MCSFFSFYRRIFLTISKLIVYYVLVCLYIKSFFSDLMCPPDDDSMRYETDDIAPGKKRYVMSSMFVDNSQLLVRWTGCSLIKLYMYMFVCVYMVSFFHSFALLRISFPLCGIYYLFLPTSCLVFI